MEYCILDGNEFSKIRGILGKTQKKLAQLLWVSVKAIQSFEQGWREIPPHIERQMLFLYIMNRDIMPLLFQDVLEGKLSGDPAELVLNQIRIVCRMYARACGLSNF